MRREENQVNAVFWKLSEENVLVNKKRVRLSDALDWSVEARTVT